MNPGIYKVYNKIHDAGVVNRRLLGRLLIHDNKLYLLEDHGLNGLFLEGELSEDHEKNFQRANSSHYWKIEKEESGIESSLGE